MNEGIALPAATVHRILLRYGLMRVEDRHRQALKRFERERPNELWQMDFKSPKGWNKPVGPLSVIDDASRYVIALEGTWTTCAEAVQERLTAAFIECGLPDAMLMDHGTPWWNTKAAGGWSQLTVWLMKQDIRLHFCAIRHPQTGVPTDRSRSVGWRPKVRWNVFTARWRWPAVAVDYPARNCIRAGWTTSAMNTTTNVPMKHWR
jgi:transposase InsO family protein